ncbi:MAG TPA: SRPBCC domain-containing protein [Chloroflexota bacterium]|nr:SRPBCC domain-containing protein [Chloroflexota bacterium]
MSSDRTVEHEIEVPGTPEQVWQAIATGQGITAWFVPTKVEERAGGLMELDFGPGVGTASGTVTVWEPPTRFVHLGSGAAGHPVAYEWHVEARSGGTCVVRLVASGFVSDADWQAEYDSTAEGWKLFLNNLRLYLVHFAGQRCASMLVQQLSELAADDHGGCSRARSGCPRRRQWDSRSACQTRRRCAGASNASSRGS